MLALMAVSTCVGVAFKVSQTQGSYHYSPISAVVMTEVFKLIVSLMVLTRMAYTRAMEQSLSLHRAWVAQWNETCTLRLAGHQLLLAVGYLIVNLVTFPIHVYASASSFILLKASSPVATAIMLRGLVGRRIGRLQWLSICMQVVGLLATQVNMCTLSLSIQPIGYVLILLNIVVSCLAAVWNENIIKRHGGSVNVQNVVLYSFGMILSMALYHTVPPESLGLKAHSGSFFDGYTWRVWFLVASSGSIGLVITAVYKYADVIVKTFGLAGSTAVLYLVEAMGIIGHVDRRGSSPLVLGSGSMLIFYAAYSYIAPSEGIEWTRTRTMMALAIITISLVVLMGCPG